MTELSISEWTFEAMIQNTGSSMHINEARISEGTARVEITNGMTALDWVVRNSKQEMARLLTSEATRKRIKSRMLALYQAARLWFWVIARKLEYSRNIKAIATFNGNSLYIKVLY